MERKRCEKCGRDFAPVKRTRRFCSKSCSNGSRTYGGRNPIPFYQREAERIKRERKERYASDPEYRKRVLARVYAAKHGGPRKPCERCGADRADRHHDDYDKPMQFVWLCRSCHIRRHVELRGSWGAGLRKAN